VTVASFADDVREMAKGWRWTRRPLVPRSAEPFQPPYEKPEFPTEWARTDTARAARDLFHRAVLKPVVFGETAVEVGGLDNLEGLKGPVMFVSNHSSHIDASLILSSLPPKWRDRVAVGAAADYFFDAWWKSVSTAFVYNAFPIDRSKRGAAISTARRLIEEGWSLVVFPEGTRSRDGWMQRFRHGSARLCIETQIPAVPIGIRGASAAYPTGNRWIRAGRLPVSIRFGEAIVPEEGEDHRGFSRRMTQGVARLIDEDKTTWFEAVQREARGQTPLPSGPEGPKWQRIWEGSRPLPRRGAKRAWGPSAK
jgi:1-acyl-sn-glycerol-3-phosphate acyltransferase